MNILHYFNMQRVVENIPFAKTTRGESCQPVVKYLPKITTLELFSALVSMPAGSQCFRKMTCNGCTSVPVFFFSFFACFSFINFGPSLCMECCVQTTIHSFLFLSLWQNVTSMSNFGGGVCVNHSNHPRNPLLC